MGCFSTSGCSFLCDAVSLLNSASFFVACMIPISVLWYARHRGQQASTLLLQLVVVASLSRPSNNFAVLEVPHRRPTLRDGFIRYACRPMQIDYLVPNITTKDQTENKLTLCSHMAPTFSGRTKHSNQTAEHQQHPCNRHRRRRPTRER